MKRHCVLCLTLILLAGCGTTGPVPTDEFYRLPEPKAFTAAPFSGKTIRIAPFDAVALYRDRAIVYGEESGLVLRRHHYHFWIDGPPNLVRGALLNAIRGASPAVTALDDSAGNADFEVQGRIDAFERYPDDNDSSVTVALTLILRRGGDTLLSRTYRESVTAGSEQMLDSVTAFGGALQRIFDRFAADIVSLGRDN